MIGPCGLGPDLLQVAVAGTLKPKIRRCYFFGSTSQLYLKYWKTPTTTATTLAVDPPMQLSPGLRLVLCEARAMASLVSSSIVFLRELADVILHLRGDLDGQTCRQAGGRAYGQSGMPAGGRACERADRRACKRAGVILHLRGDFSGRLGKRRPCRQGLSNA